MSRRNKAQERIIDADPVYNSVRIAKFINYLMWEGKGSVASTIAYTFLGEMSAKSGIPIVELFEEIIQTLSPTMETKTRRVGGSNYQVPIAVVPKRGFMLACQFLIDEARKRKGKAMYKKLIEESVAALEGAGGAIKKRREKERAAESNKAFAHFKW